jgi:hypothetical protein
MIIYNVFIPFYPKKSIKTPFGALIFQQFGQRFENCNRTYQCVFILRLVDSCQSYGPLFVLCMQLVIYYLADFVHIWYNGDYL